MTEEQYATSMELKSKEYMLQSEIDSLVDHIGLVKEYQNAYSGYDDVSVHLNFQYFSYEDRKRSYPIQIGADLVIRMLEEQLRIKKEMLNTVKKEFEKL